MKKVGLLFATLPFVLTACGGNSIPKKGYDKFKDLIASQYVPFNAFKINICYYVYITGNGSMNAGSLKGSVYYAINYTLLSVTATTFAVYYSSSNYVEETSSTAYRYAYSLVADGSLSGERGYL